MNMSKRILNILILTIFISATSLFAQELVEQIALGHTIRIPSKILNEDRDIFIYLPVGYHDSERTYPVFYMLDGRGHFHHGTGVVQFMSQNGMMPQTIVVAIPNTARNRDFTPTLEKGRATGGGAENFLNFMQNELMPIINARYRTHDYRILFGHSLTGMFTAYTLATHPTLFNAYIIASPYLQYDEEIAIKKSAKLCSKESLKNKTVFMTLGDEPGYVASLDRYTEVLKGVNAKDFKWKYVTMQQENHGSIPHKTIYQGLEFIFNGWRIPAEKANDLASIQSHYGSLTEKFGFSVKPQEFLLNQLGYTSLGNKEYDKAIELFRANVAYHPNSNNVYDSLGEAYEKSGNLKLALKNYKTAMEKGEIAKSPNLPIYVTNFKRAQAQLNGSSH